MKKNLTRVLVLLAVILLAGAYFYFDAGKYLTLENLKSHEAVLKDYVSSNPLKAGLIYFCVYVIITALSLPGAAVMTLAGGAIFGLLWATVIVSFASTIGATLAFIISRFLFRDLVQKKFGDKLRVINEGVKREGAFYLFTLRLVPLFPFFVINLVMALTPIKTATFYLVSQLGMLPGTLAYVNAGRELAKINSLSGILSPGLILSFVIIGILPLVSRAVVNYLRARKVLKRFSRPDSFDYNLVVIGAGSAGLVSSYIAAAVRAKVALIEKHRMGGDCLNTGCVPSKALIRSAKMLSYAARAKEFGFRDVSVDFNFAEVMERVQKVIKAVEPHDSVERYSSLGVDCYQGAAKILDPYRVEVNGQVLKTRNIIVATGATPLVPPIAGLDQIDYLTSDTIWDIRELPEKFVVLGGGPIGSELAQAFSRLGAKVSVVERSERIMTREDREISAMVMDRFEKEGINLYCGYTATKFEVIDGKNYLICESEDKQERIEFDRVLVALGRRANVKGFGLEELGVELSERGTIRTDSYLRTNFPNIYVCGDAAGPYQFTHTAAHQAWYASVNALFSPFKSFKADYSVIPWCTFVDPEVARVGLNELEAKERGIEYEVTRYGIDDLDRAIADSEAHGVIKVLTVPGKDKILGVTIVGPHAGDLIAEYVFAMKHGLGLNSILSTIHIYPTLAEANKYAAGAWKKQHAPERLLRLVEKFHSFRRGKAKSRKVAVQANT
ncbi:MAG: pyridine nucleotide-disulfide oxidoreductase [Candidatus Dadabacteria bacterium]|nr:MAG: pyridine nucleotide-disulfide oxidoreductase [Candidatus Dadabacteria bacterium]